MDTGDREAFTGGGSVFASRAEADVAMATTLPAALEAFLRAHEHGRRLEVGRVTTPGTVTLEVGRLDRTWALHADAHATREMIERGKITTVETVVRYFFGQGLFPFVPTHPPCAYRAQNIIATAASEGVHLDL